MPQQEHELTEQDAINAVTNARFKIIEAEIAAEKAAETRDLPKNLERRQYTASEIRAETSSGKRILRGYGAKWNTLSSDLGGLREMLAPGCFSRCLARSNRDLALLYGHDPNQILARESAGTFDVEEDSIGLKFKAQLSQTHLADDVFENVKAGNIAGCSFAMIVRSDSWSECDPEDEDEDCQDDEDDRARRVPLRLVTDADIFEVSVVVFPAYPATTVAAGARSLWPAGVPESFPLEIRSRIISETTAGHLNREEEEELRMQMRFAAIRATL